MKQVIDGYRPIATVAPENGVGEGALGNWVAAYRREHAGEGPDSMNGGTGSSRLGAVRRGVEVQDPPASAVMVEHVLRPQGAPLDRLNTRPVSSYSRFETLAVPLPVQGVDGALRQRDPGAAIWGLKVAELGVAVADADQGA